MLFLVLRPVLAGAAAFAYARLTGLPQSAVLAWTGIAIVVGVAFERLLAITRRRPQPEWRSFRDEAVAELTWSNVAVQVFSPLATLAMRGIFDSIGSSVSGALRKMFSAAVDLLGKAAGAVATIQLLQGRSLLPLLAAFIAGALLGSLALSLVIGRYQSRPRVHQFMVQGPQRLRVTLPVGGKAGQPLLVRYLVMDSRGRPILPQPEGHLEIVGTTLGSRPYQDGGANYPELRWDVRADAGTYNASLSFEKLIFSGASIEGFVIPPGSPLKDTANLATPFVDGARLQFSVLTRLGLTLWQQNAAMALGAIVATVGVALEILRRGKTGDASTRAPTTTST
jgi:hypothetical protein